MLAESESLEFLCKRTDRSGIEEAEREAMGQLAAELGHLPLALEQAGAYIATREARFQDYLASFRRRRIELLSRSRPATGRYPAEVATTWSINFQQVEETCAGSSDLLRLSAFLSPDNIPAELIVAGASLLGPHIAEALDGVEDDPVLLSELLEPLARFSLIDRKTVTECYSIHPLVQEVVIDNLEESDRLCWAERALRAAAAVCPKDVEYASWQRWDRLLPHVCRAIELIGSFGIETEEAVSLTICTALYRDKRGSCEEAASLYTQAIDLATEALGESHPSVTIGLHNLARIRMAQQRYDEARQLGERALILLRKRGEQDSIVARAIDTLGDISREQGRYEEAAELHEEALKIIEAKYGSDHPRVASCLISLGSDFRAQRLYDKAISIDHRALEIAENGLGRHHPELFPILNCIGCDYAFAGDPQRAELFFRRALLLLETIQGPDHPDVANALMSLGGVYSDRELYEEAAAAYSRALTVLENAYGLLHPHVARTLYELARVHQKDNELDKAEEELRRALDVLRDLRDPSDLALGRVANRLALLCRQRGRSAEADELIKQFQVVVAQARQSDS